MASFDGNTHVFIVRVWREPREIEGAMPEWRGTIEYMPSAEKLCFKNLEAAIAFIIEKSGAETMQPPLSTGQRDRASLLHRLLASLGLQERHNE